MTFETANGGVHVGYARVSTEDQDAELQIQALMKFGIPRNHIFIDVMSGAKMKRPELAKMMRMLRRGDCVVVWKMDRLGRSVLGVLEVVRTFEERGIDLKSITEPIDTQTPIGRVVMTILLALAQMERDLISERTKAGMAAKRERDGKKPGPKHKILGYPKRLAALRKLHADGKLDMDAPKDKSRIGMTGEEIVEALNKADPKAPRIKGTAMWYNWRAAGFPGYTLIGSEPAQPVDE